MVNKSILQIYLPKNVSNKILVPNYHTKTCLYNSEESVFTNMIEQFT